MLPYNALVFIRCRINDAPSSVELQDRCRSADIWIFLMRAEWMTAPFISAQTAIGLARSGFALDWKMSALCQLRTFFRLPERLI